MLPQASLRHMRIPQPLPPLNKHTCRSSVLVAAVFSASSGCSSFSCSRIASSVLLVSLSFAMPSSSRRRLSPSSVREVCSRWAYWASKSR